MTNTPNISAYVKYEVNFVQLTLISISWHFQHAISHVLNSVAQTHLRIYSLALHGCHYPLNLPSDTKVSIMRTFSVLWDWASKTYKTPNWQLEISTFEVDVSLDPWPKCRCKHGDIFKSVGGLGFVSWSLGSRTRWHIDVLLSIESIWVPSTFYFVRLAASISYKIYIIFRERSSLQFLQQKTLPHKPRRPISSGNPTARFPQRSQWYGIHVHQPHPEPLPSRNNYQIPTPLVVYSKAPDQSIVPFVRW